MPPDSDRSRGVLLLARGHQTLCIARAEACGRTVYIGFMSDEPLVVTTQPWSSLGALLKAVGLLKREK